MATGPQYPSRYPKGTTLPVDLDVDQLAWNPDGNDDAKTFQVNPTVDSVYVGGLDGGADGRSLFLFNTNTSNSFRIGNEDTNAAESDRFSTIGAAEITVPAAAGDFQSGVFLTYTNSRWRMIAKNF